MAARDPGVDLRPTADHVDPRTLRDLGSRYDTRRAVRNRRRERHDTHVGVSWQPPPGSSVATLRAGRDCRGTRCRILNGPSTAPRFQCLHPAVRRQWTQCQGRDVTGSAPARARPWSGATPSRTHRPPPLAGSTPPATARHAATTDSTEPVRSARGRRSAADRRVWACRPCLLVTGQCMQQQFGVSPWFGLQHHCPLPWSRRCSASSVVGRQPLGLWHPPSSSRMLDLDRPWFRSARKSPWSLHR